MTILDFIRSQSNVQSGTTYDIVLGIRGTDVVADAIILSNLKDVSDKNLVSETNNTMTIIDKTDKNIIAESNDVDKIKGL